MKFFHVWILNMVAFSLICVGALLTVSYDTCDKLYPILLSRAGTTDPWRGLLITLGLWMAFCASKIEDSQLIIAFCGFLLAFVVSMFETSAHMILIIFSAVFVMIELYQKLSEEREVTVWVYIAIASGISGVVWTSWCVYSYLTEWPLCSFWYLSEYIFFGLLFISTCSLVDNDKEFEFGKSRKSRTEYSRVSSSPGSTGSLLHPQDNGLKM